MPETITGFIRLVLQKIRGGCCVCSNSILLAVVILAVAPAVGQVVTLPGVTLQRIVDSYKTDPFVLYSECSVENGKAILIVAPAKDVWFYEFDEGELLNSGQVEFTTDGVVVKASFGGFFSQARMSRIVAALVRAPFELLTRGQFEKMITSKPNSKCPEVKPSDLRQKPDSKE